MVLLEVLDLYISTKYFAYFSHSNKTKFHPSASAKETWLGIFEHNSSNKIVFEKIFE